jgi:hypothetical protein
MDGAERKGVTMAWKYDPRISKYGSKKIEIDGVKFDSKREATRWTQLKLLERAGEITDLKRQVKFLLIPARREPDIIGPKGGVKKGRIIEREASYVADFVYKDKNGETVVEDSKGFRTKEFILKRKLMLWIYDIQIKEV